MKKLLFLFAALVSLLFANAQKMQFGRLVFEVPSGFRAEKSDNTLWIYNMQKQLCIVVYSFYPVKGNIEETHWQLWNSEEKFPNYAVGEMTNRYRIGEEGSNAIRADYESESENGRISKSVLVYDNGKTCEAIIAYSTDEETKYALGRFLKNIQFIISPPPVQLTPLERSFQWYRALRGPDVSNSSIQTYQSQTALNFTGFIAASQTHLQALGDSLFYLRELSNLQTLLIGQTRFDDAAAANIGTLTAIKHIQTVSQGFGVPITNNGLQSLSNAQTLEVIDLRGIDITGVTDAGLAHLARLTNLRKLIISRASRITINGFEQLTPLKQLQELDLSYCNLTDADLPRLTAVIQQLPALRTLFIQTTAMTPEATIQLRQTFPAVTIYR
jgi:hypothetical protein